MLVSVMVVILGFFAIRRLSLLVNSLYVFAIDRLLPAHSLKSLLTNTKISVQLHAGNFLEVGCEQVNPDSLNLVGQFGILHHGANRNQEHRLLWAVIAPVRLLLRGIPTLASDEPQCGQYGSSWSAPIFQLLSHCRQVYWCLA